MKSMILTNVEEHGITGTMAAGEFLHIQISTHPHRRVPCVRKFHLSGVERKGVLPNGDTAERDLVTGCRTALQDDR